MKKIPSRHSRKYDKGDLIDLPANKTIFNPWQSTTIAPVQPSSFSNPQMLQQLATPVTTTVPVQNSTNKIFGGATNAGTNTSRNLNYGGIDWREEDYNKGRQLTNRQRQYQSIWNPHLENQAQQSGVSLNDKYNGYLTPEKQQEVLAVYNKANGTDFSVEDYNKNVLGGLNTLYSNYRPEGYNLRGQQELGQGSQGNVNLYGWKNYSAANDFAEVQPATAGVNKITLPEQSANPTQDPLAGLDRSPIINSRYKKRPDMDLAGLLPLALNPSVREADKLNLPKLRLEHPVITQPDVDRPIAQITAQASGMLQRNRTTDLASRVAMTGQLQSGVNDGIQKVYDNSAQFTEAKRAEAIPILNQENVADYENKKYMNVDDVNYQRQRVAQVLSGLSARNNQNAQTAAIRRSENQARNNRNAQYDYQLTGMEYDNRISEINNRIQSGKYSKAELDKLSQEKTRLEKERMGTMKSIIYSSEKGGVIISRYAKGGKVNPMTMEDKKQTNRLEMADKNFHLKKQLLEYSNALKKNTDFLKNSQSLLQSNLALIGKRFDTKMPKHSIPSSYKKA